MRSLCTTSNALVVHDIKCSLRTVHIVQSISGVPHFCIMLVKIGYKLLLLDLFLVNIVAFAPQKPPIFKSLDRSASPSKPSSLSQRTCTALNMGGIDDNAVSLATIIGSFATDFGSIILSSNANEPNLFRNDIGSFANYAAVFGFPFLLATWIKEDIKDLKNDVGKKFDDVGKQFDDVGKKFDDVGKKFDDVGKKFDESDNKMKTQFDTLQAIVLAKVETQDKIIGSYDISAKAHMKAMDAHEKKIEVMFLLHEKKLEDQIKTFISNATIVQNSALEN
jgi:hypothetical protein